MKKTIIILSAIALLACNHAAKNKPTATENFSQYLADYPIIKDTATFIAELKSTYKIEVYSDEEYQKITAFKKIKLNGSDNDYFLIELDYGYGSMAEYPWQYQLILTENGKFLKQLSAERLEPIAVFPDQNPFLMAVIVTGKGNGGHEIYKITADTLENVYEGYYDCDVRTYDAHKDGNVYEPNELELVVKDFNKDGYNDIAFKGQIVFSDELKDDISVEYIFLYEPKTGHFKAKEKYKIYE